jgi:hypothetical protein
MIDRFEYINVQVSPDEPVFILRAQDVFAAHLVERWAELAASAGCNHIKVREAKIVAAEMCAWPTKKIPD